MSKIHYALKARGKHDALIEIGREEYGAINAIAAAMRAAGVTLMFHRAEPEQGTYLMRLQGKSEAINSILKKYFTTLGRKRARKETKPKAQKVPQVFSLKKQYESVSPTRH